MTVIFDLQQSGAAWADSVNEALKADWPEYIESNGLVGSHQWWQNYHAKAVPHEKKAGVVTFIGERVDEFDEQYESVEIDLDGMLVEYDRCGYWEHDGIATGTKLVVEAFEICVRQKYGPTTFKFERLVEIINT